MMKDNKTILTQITKHLTSLSPAELDQVQARIQFLNTHTEADHVPKITLELYEALGVVLADQYQHLPPWNVFAKSSDGARYLRQLPCIEQFLAMVEPLQRLERRALLVYMLRLVLKQMTAYDIPLRLRTVVNQLHTIPSVFEQAFPGYAHAQLLPWVLKSLYQSSV